MTFRDDLIIRNLLLDSPIWRTPQSADGWPFRCEMKIGQGLARLSSKGNALKALNAMERELDSPRTYEQIRKVVQAAESKEVHHNFCRCAVGKSRS
jgi:hypothetical protein